MVSGQLDKAIEVVLADADLLVVPKRHYADLLGADYCEV